MCLRLVWAHTKSCRNVGYDHHLLLWNQSSVIRHWDQPLGLGQPEKHGDKTGGWIQALGLLETSLPLTGWATQGKLPVPYSTCCYPSSAKPMLLFLIYKVRMGVRIKWNRVYRVLNTVPRHKWCLLSSLSLLTLWGVVMGMGTKEQVFFSLVHNEGYWDPKSQNDRPELHRRFLVQLGFNNIISLIPHTNKPTCCLQTISMVTSVFILVSDLGHFASGF